MHSGFYFIFLFCLSEEQVLEIRKEHIRRYIEDALASGVPIDDMTCGFKLFNDRNKWNLDDSLFNQVYAEYFTEPAKKTAALEQKVGYLEQKLAGLMQVNSYHGRCYPQESFRYTR